MLSTPRYTWLTTLPEKKLIPWGEKRHHQCILKCRDSRGLRAVTHIQTFCTRGVNEQQEMVADNPSTENSVLPDTDLQSPTPHSQIYKLYEQAAACVSKFSPLLAVYSSTGEGWLGWRNRWTDSSKDQVKDMLLPLCFSSQSPEPFQLCTCPYSRSAKPVCFVIAINLPYFFLETILKIAAFALHL